MWISLKDAVELTSKGPKWAWRPKEFDGADPARQQTVPCAVKVDTTGTGRTR